MYTIIRTLPNVLFLYLTLTIIISTHAAIVESPDKLVNSDVSALPVLDISPFLVNNDVKRPVIKGTPYIQMSEIIHSRFALCLSSGVIPFESRIC